jgi:hypothetical protein
MPDYKAAKDDKLSKIIEEIRKNPEILINKYLKADKLILREDSDGKGVISYRTYKDVVVLYTEGVATFIDEEGKLHQVNPDVVQEIIYSADASLWMRHLMLFSASQMINQLIISKKFEQPEL